jgi:hypothetical protein
MKYDPDIHHRRSIRLKGYDYSQAGAYFVTICAQNLECLFGEILDEEMALNDAGRMIETIWHELPEHYPGVGIDAFQVMPNHMHGIVIVGAGISGHAKPYARHCYCRGRHRGLPLRRTNHGGHNRRHPRKPPLKTSTQTSRRMPLARLPGKSRGPSRPA